MYAMKIEEIKLVESTEVIKFESTTIIRIKPAFNTLAPKPNAKKLFMDVPTALR